jgi:hypothetical protein
MATTTIVVPSARRGGTGVSPYTVRFRWNANPEPVVTGYALYPTRISGDYDAVTPVDMGNATTGSYVIQRPQGNGVWYFSLTAYTAGQVDESPLSTELTITIT